MSESAVPPPSEKLPAPETAPAPGPPEGVLKGDQGLDVALMAFSAFLIVVAGFAAFANVFSIPFHGEDLTRIRANVELRSLLTVPQAFESFPAAPLTLFTYALNWGLTPDRSAEFHLFGLLLHLANALLVYLICRRLARGALPEPVAMLAGMLFVVHPLTSESVAYLIGRPMLLGTCFALLSIWMFLRATQPEEPRYVLLGGAIAAYVLAVASSFAFVLMPLALFGVDAAASPPGRMRQRWRIHAMFVLAMLALLVVLAAIPRERPFPPVDAPGGIAVLSQMSGHFVALILTPFQLNPLWNTDLLGSISWAGLLFYLLLLAGAGALLVRGAFPGAGLLWSAVALAGAAFLLPPDQAYSERGLYPAVAGVCLLLPWLFLLVSDPLPRKILGGVAAAVILAAMWQTFLRLAVWQEPQQFWERVAEAEEARPDPYLHIARYLEGQLPRAVDNIQTQNALMSEAAGYWQRVLNRDPANTEALTGYGIRRFVQQNPAEAIPLLERSLRDDPNQQQAAIYLALAYEATAEGETFREALESALQYYAHAQSLGVLPPDLLTRIALANLQAGRLQQALPLLATAAQMQPEGNAAMTLEQLMPIAERMAQLEQQAQDLHRQDAGDMRASVLRAEVRMLRGDALGAFYLLDRYLRRDPASTEAWYLLGGAHAQLGTPEVFLREWAQHKANDQEAWRQLALRTARGGRWNAALAYLEDQSRRQPGADLPKLQLAAIAMELEQPQAAIHFLQEAATETPDNPEPWLRLADLAIAVDNREEAQRLLGEAQRRGASEEALQQRTEEAGVVPEVAPTVPRRTIIR